MDLHQAAKDYVTVRRALGSKLERRLELLESFVDYLEAAGAPTVTTELAVSWARLPGPQAHPTYVSNRLCAVRGFARHLQAFEPATEVPPVDLLPRPKCRAVPYLYSDADVQALMTAARSLTPALKSATYEALIGTLSVAGLRISEAIRLDRDDVDWDEGVLVIWRTKFGKSREAPLHPSAVEALKRYSHRRDQLCPEPKSASFFVSPTGARLVEVTVQATFRRIVRAAGLQSGHGRRGPRLHDMRHSLACSVLLSWYRDGVDVEAHMPILSTYLGHGTPSSSYWYISAVPELLALAAKRRDHLREVRS